MLKLFRLNQPLLAYIIFPFAALFLLPSFLKGHTIILSNISFLLPDFYSSSSVFAYLIVTLFIGLNSILINRFANMFLRNSYKNFIAGFFYVFVTCIFFYWFPFFEHIIVVPFLLFSFNYLLNINSQKNILDFCFKSGFWLGVAAILDFKVIYLFVFYPLSLIFSRNSSFREWLTMLVGLVVPIFILYMLNLIFFPSHSIIWRNVEILQSIDHSLFAYIFLISSLILLLLAVKSFYSAFEKAVRNDKISKKTFLFVIGGIVLVALLDSFFTNRFSGFVTSIYYLIFLLALTIPTIFKLLKKEKWVVLLLNLYFIVSIIFIISDYFGFNY